MEILNGVHLSVAEVRKFPANGSAERKETAEPENGFEAKVQAGNHIPLEADGENSTGNQDFNETEARGPGNGKQAGSCKRIPTTTERSEKMNGREEGLELCTENGHLQKSHSAAGLANGEISRENGWDDVTLNGTHEAGENEDGENKNQMGEKTSENGGETRVEEPLDGEISPENDVSGGQPGTDESMGEGKLVVVPHSKLPRPEPPRGSTDPEEARHFERSQSEPADSGSIGRFFRERSSALLKRFSSSTGDSAEVIDGVNQFHLPGLKVTVYLKPQGPELRGRVTFFSRSGCRDCTAVRTFFCEKRLRFVEINIDVFPAREEELVQRTGSSAVPAIFFNEKLLGGLVALNSLRNSGEFDRRLAEMIADRCPETAPAPPIYGFDDEPGPEQRPDVLAEVVAVLRHRLPIQDRLMRMKIVRNCFSGSEAVEALIEHLDCGRKKAIEVARELARKHFFHHVFQENDFEDGNHFYRFLEHEQFIPKCFNYRNSPNDDEPKPAIQVGQRLTKIMTAILESYASNDRRHIDYVRISTSEEFRRYVNLIEDLQRVDMLSLSVDERLVFFLNLYNAMVIHALIRMGRPEGVMDRRALFHEFQYLIGGQPYSLSAIKNGILRCNRRQPYSLAKPFGGSDKRLQLALPKPNPLIHFGLCDGTRSSPRVRFFSAESIEAELRYATREFFREDGVEVDLEKRTVYLSKIIKWYTADFGQDRALLNWVLNYLDATKAGLLTHLIGDGAPFNIVYMNYDWSLNV
ncbi:uncharacterized protein LOC116260299 [Nymphaea colorata]|nr:uncharacterized protein LOC116260299 [Nymphaea colorata]